MYDREEDFPEQPEYCELTEKINELIDEAVKAKIEGTVNSLELFRKTNASLGEKIRKLESQIRNFEPDLKTALLEKEQEVKRTIFDGFTIGDKVYYADSGKGKKIICNNCNGSSEVDAMYNNAIIKIDCPSCSGNFYSKWVYTYTVQTDTINWLRVTFEDINKKWIKFHVKKRDSELEPSNIFRTIEECQARCDELNRKEQEKLAN